MERVESAVTALTTQSVLPLAVKITLDKLCRCVNVLADEVEKLKAAASPEPVVVVEEEKEEVSDEEG